MKPKRDCGCVWDYRMVNYTTIKGQRRAWRRFKVKRCAKHALKAAGNE